MYQYALEKKLVDLIYLTRIHATIEGDTFFPEINLKEWKKIDSKFHEKDEKHKFSFTFLIFEKLN